MSETWMGNAEDREHLPQSIGERLGFDGVETIVSRVGAYCECERRRIDLTNQPRILAARAEGANLQERERDLKEQLRNAPPPGDLRSRRREVLYNGVTAGVLIVAALFFSLLTFDPFRLGWKAYLYCLGIVVAVPFGIEKCIASWSSARLIRALATITCVAGLTSLVLLALTRGNVLAQEINHDIPTLVMLDEMQTEPQPQNSFYEDTVILLRWTMALLALAMELGAALALHEAMRMLSYSQVDPRTLQRQLDEVQRQMVERIHELSALSNEAAAFEAGFWRDFYGAMITHTVRSALTKLTVFLVLLLMPCAAFAQTRLNLVIAIDLSGSVATKGHDENTAFNKNVAAISRLLAQVPAGSRVTIIGITDNSFTQPYILLSAEVSENEGYFKEKLTAARHGLAKAWKKCAAQLEPKFQETDVLGAMRLAGQVFQGTRPDQKKTLVVFSDMVQETRSLNLTKSVPVSGTGWKFNREDKKLVPELEGAEIHVLGVELPKGQVNNWHSIRSFWTTFLRACGANLVQYSVLRQASDAQP